MKNVMQSAVMSGHRKRRRRYIASTSLLFLTVIFLCILALVLGKTSYPFESVVRVLLGEDIDGAAFAVRTLKLPRMVAALFVGMAFGLAGSTFQTMLRNPLASPDIIGVTAGSSVAAVYGILILNLSGQVISMAALVSGLLVTLLIYCLSRKGSFSGGKLILIGIGVQAMLSSVVSYLLLRASQHDVPYAMRWLSGSLNGIRMSSIGILPPVVVIFGGVIILLGKQLKILELGEERAVALGVRTSLIRSVLIICAVVLIAFSTSVTGPIAFVSFLSGPIAGKITGKGAPAEFASALVGASLVLGADLMGQFAFSTSYPVGVITGIIGAPYLLYLLIGMNRKGGVA